MSRVEVVHSEDLRQAIEAIFDLVFDPILEAVKLLLNAAREVVPFAFN